MCFCFFKDILPGSLNGKVIRSLRIVNPDQDEYPGQVQVVNTGRHYHQAEHPFAPPFSSALQDIILLTSDGSEGERYSYGITSLADKRDFLQTGDVVRFQVAVVRGSGKKRATNIAAAREYIRAKVESVKGQVRDALAKLPIRTLQ